MGSVLHRPCKKTGIVVRRGDSRDVFWDIKLIEVGSLVVAGRRIAWVPSNFSCHDFPHHREDDDLASALFPKKTQLLVSSLSLSLGRRHLSNRENEKKPSYTRDRHSPSLYSNL